MAWFSEEYSYRRKKSWVLVPELPLPSYVAFRKSFDVAGTSLPERGNFFCLITSTEAIDVRALGKPICRFQVYYFFGCQYLRIWDK